MESKMESKMESNMEFFMNVQTFSLLGVSATNDTQL